MQNIAIWIAAFLSAVAGSLGLGGGGILLLYLAAFLNMEQLKAQGINLAFFLPIAVISILIHAKNHLIQWKLVLPMVLTGCLGVALGTMSLNWIPTGILSKCFAAFLFFLGIRELFSKKAPDTLDKPS